MLFKMLEPARTIRVYDKGSNYLLLDSDNVTILYNVHINDNTLPHMAVTHTIHGSTHRCGSASFIPTKKFGFLHTAPRVELTLGSRRTDMTKDGGPFSTDKRAFETSRGTMFWKGGVSATAFLRLVDDQGNTVATYKNEAYSGNVMGKFEIFTSPLEDNELDEVIVSGLAMLSEQKTSMGQTAANMASAGGMG